MRALLVSRDGMLGAAILAELATGGIDCFSTSRRHDSAKPDEFLELEDSAKFKLPPHDVLFLVAAVARVVDCESNPQPTWRINADAPIDLSARSKKLYGAHTVFISSDAVERAPSLNYSRQKAYVESFILAHGGTVLRPSRIPPAMAQNVAGKAVRLGLNLAHGLFRWEG